jgi:hypothetical protein
MKCHSNPNIKDGVQKKISTIDKIYHLCLLMTNLIKKI